MTDEERKETDAKKLKDSKSGKQFVQDTGAAKNARQKAYKETDKEFKRRKVGKAQDDMGESEGNGRDDGEDDIEADTTNTGQKRNRATTDNEDENEEVPNKKKKSTPKSIKEKRTKSDKRKSKFHRSNRPATSGSLDRLPGKGQTVRWISLQGWVEDTVLKVAHEETEVEGETIKAKGYPRIVMRSKNGKIAVHKRSAIYFD